MAVSASHSFLRKWFSAFGMREMIVVGKICHGHTNTNTHTREHTCSSVWENRDRGHSDLTIAKRKRSIKQQVHFAAKAFKNMANITLQELCRRGQEINPRGDSTDMWEGASPQCWKTKPLEVFKWGKKGKKSNSWSIRAWGESSKIL